jgi:uncharacterized protein YjeT (DUF2065 family)
MKYFFSVIAMVLIIEGLPYFAFPDKMKNILKIMSETNSESLRKIGLFLILTGLALLYFTK